MIYRKFIFKGLHGFLGIAVIVFFLGCNGNPEKKSGASQPIVTKEADPAALFLAYTDSVTKFPLARFNETGITTLNQNFDGKLPIVIYKRNESSGEQHVVVQVYHNQDTASTIKAGAVMLLPKPISDALQVADFTRRFGAVKKEKPIISPTEQPLPVLIDINNNTALKLTFNNNEKLEIAHVIMVEVLKYK